MAIRRLWVLAVIAWGVVLAPLALACETSQSASPCGGMADAGAAPQAADCPRVRASDPTRPPLSRSEAATAWPVSPAVVPLPRPAAVTAPLTLLPPTGFPAPAVGHRDPGLRPLRI